jgi:branched-chain amino acid transport system permease protein
MDSTKNATAANDDVLNRRRSRPRSVLSVVTSAPTLVAVAVVIVAYTISNGGTLLQLATALTYGLAATGLGMALGLGGEYLLGQGAVFATSAYVTGALCATDGLNYWLAAVLGVVAAIIVGLVMSLIGLRVSKFYFAMVGFFLVFLIPSFVQAVASQTGGSEGLSITSLPVIFGYTLSNRGMVLLAGAALVVGLIAMANIRSSPLGVHMRRLRDSPVHLAASGVAPWRTRAAIYVISAALAGIGGAIYTQIGGFLQPTDFDVTFTVLLFAAVVVGGSTSLAGPCIGVIALYVIPQIVIQANQYSDLIYGAIVLISILAFRGGIEKVLRDSLNWLLKRMGTSSRSTDARDASSGAQRDDGSVEDLIEILLDIRAGTEQFPLIVKGAKVHFGGVAAVNFNPDDSIEVLPGRIEVLLGPNGSGKTTLLNALCGIQRLDEGSVTLGGRDLQGMSQTRVARAGVGRSFQSPNLPNEITPRDILRATFCQLEDVSFAHWLFADLKARRVRRRADALAVRLGDAAGLGAFMNAPCRALTSGQRRIMDVLLALVSRANVILLDEPAAGLSELERERLGAVMKGLAERGVAFMMVEHDLNLALGIAHSVSVLAAGRLIASGPPGGIRQDPQVRAELLGIVP